MPVEQNFWGWEFESLQMLGFFLLFSSLSYQSCVSFVTKHGLSKTNIMLLSCSWSDFLPASGFEPRSAAREATLHQKSPALIRLFSISFNIVVQYSYQLFKYCNSHLAYKAAVHIWRPPFLILGRPGPPPAAPGGCNLASGPGSLLRSSRCKHQTCPMGPSSHL